MSPGAVRRSRFPRTKCLSRSLHLPRSSKPHSPPIRLAHLALGALLLAIPFSARADGPPDVTRCFYVPQVGAVAAPTEGTLAARLFRMCPNNDGGASLPNHARIKIVILDAPGNPIAGIARADICLLFNGGTQAQGFSGLGADSIIANSVWNQSPLCPDVTCVQADAPSDANGVAYITFAGADPANPGVTVRDPNRKWGHYDSEIPVYVLGYKILGQLTTASAPGTYMLRIKSFDWTGGLGATLNAGEAVTMTDFNGVANGINVNNAVSYWKDFDGSGSVTMTDFNALVAHINHTCTYPNNP